MSTQLGGLPLAPSLINISRFQVDPTRVLREVQEEGVLFLQKHGQPVGAFLDVDFYNELVRQIRDVSRENAKLSQRLKELELELTGESGEV
jgi:hypothetical protein